MTLKPAGVARWGSLANWVAAGKLQLATVPLYSWKETTRPISPICAAYDRNTVNTDDYGIGITMRFRIARVATASNPNRQVKFTTIVSPSKMIMFGGRVERLVWEKMYYNEANPYKRAGQQCDPA